MLRTIALTFLNEFKLLVRDPVGLFMLLLAPLVIIAVAGFSLSNLYGAGANAGNFTLPVVDQDHGAVGQAINDALDHQSAFRVVRVSTVAAARAIVDANGRAPLAIVIPAGTSASIAGGKSASIALYVDPIKRIELAPIETRIARLCQAITVAAHAEALKRLGETGDELHKRVARISSDLDNLQTLVADYQQRIESARAHANAVVTAQIKRKMGAAIDAMRAQTQVAIDESMEQARASLTGQLNTKRDGVTAVQKYLTALQTSQAQFEQWFGALKAAAGSHADAIPSPPAFPTPPPATTLATLRQPIELSLPEPRLPGTSAINASLDKRLRFDLPAAPPPPKLPITQLRSDLEALAPAAPPVIPGMLGWVEESARGGNSNVNAFDQYVPGFGITFLLIGMLMGLSMGLIDERDWGTLARLRVSGAPLAGTLIGKLSARFLVGFAQMVALLAFGYWIFGVSLGRNPAMLLLPSAAIAFAAAAFGLIIACLARTHDSVMPVGTVTAMAMSAIGGCWWPLDFEPSWMRGFAHFLPTTWTMLAFNNLMIRDLPPPSAVWPSLAVIALGIAFLAVGLIGASRIYDS